MLGLTFDKLILIAILTGIIVGPQRLPAYAQKLAETVRAVRAFADAARVRAEQEMGLSLPESVLNVRQYDPRRIVRDALNTPPTSPAPSTEPATVPATSEGAAPEPPIDAARRSSDQPQA